MLFNIDAAEKIEIKKNNTSWLDLSQIKHLTVSEDIGFYLPPSSNKITLFNSYDIEANGPCPGMFSMIQLGIVICDSDGRILFQFSANLKEMEDTLICLDTQYWLEKQASYKGMIKHRKSPEKVFQELYQIYNEIKKRYSIVTVLAPAGFDKAWFTYYFVKYCKNDMLPVMDAKTGEVRSVIGNDPTGSSCRCITSYVWAAAKCKSSKRSEIGFNDYRDKGLEHTHNALDDALEQLSVFINVYNKQIN